MKRIAIVTGGSRGIGLAIVRRLIHDGHQVVMVGTRPLEMAQDHFKDLPKESYRYVQADVSTGEGRERIVSDTCSSYGRIDLLVNNAGVAPKVRADLLEMCEESWDYVLDTNTKSNMFLTQRVAKVMLSQERLYPKRGTIINISSCSSEVSSVNRGEYCVSKAGISMLTTLYADRLAPEGILVHEIRPGVIRTDMTSNVTEKYDSLIASGLFPIARWGEGEDVASAVAAFASDAFLYTTGNHIDIDGGFHIRRL